ncbi:hypothetical protein ACFVT1_25865 [Streptomyces sp. NPDC057963]|uniref:hypothetical protein n=1 Tax=Streptomyces sp. NPDC057963 TaxID=3346290 RepID=UPI0036F0FCD5
MARPRNGTGPAEPGTGPAEPGADLRTPARRDVPGGRDALHRGAPVAAEVMLRLPFDRTAEELAAAAAVALTKKSPATPAPREGVAGAANRAQVDVTRPLPS